MQPKIGRFEKYSRRIPADKWDAFKASIAKDGLREKILVAPDGDVIDGHNRVRAWSELADSKFPAESIATFFTADEDAMIEEALSRRSQRGDDYPETDKKTIARDLRFERKWAHARIGQALGVGEATSRRWLADTESPVNSTTSSDDEVDGVEPNVLDDQESSSMFKTEGADGKRRPSSYDDGTLRAKAIEMFKAGAKDQEVADTVDRSVGTVRGWKKTAGLCKPRVPKTVLATESQPEPPPPTPEFSPTSRRKHARNTHREEFAEHLAALETKCTTFADGWPPSMVWAITETVEEYDQWLKILTDSRAALETYINQLRKEKVK